MFSFDHVVHYVMDPRQAVEALKKHGFHAIEGGKHPNWGTYNSLCYFGLSYIEFLGIQDAGLARNVTDNLLIRRIVKDAQFGEGLSQIALRTYDMKSTATALKEKGFNVKEPVPGKRTQKDGSVIRWQLLFPERDHYEGPTLPFIIEWKDSDEERWADLTQQQAIGYHPVGDPTLSSIGFAVRDLQQRISEWSQWFGLEPGDTFVDNRLNARCQSLKLNGANLLFCEPNGQGPTMQTVESRGEYPFLIAISGTDTEKDVELMGTVYRFQK
jgi:hypothetical protein